MFIAIQIILLLLGMVIDVIGLVVLCVPIFVPVIKELGFDPLWFGIIFNVSLQLAYLSPPFGYGMFYLKGVTPKEITMSDLSGRSGPSWACRSSAWPCASSSPRYASGCPTC